MCTQTCFHREIRKTSTIFGKESALSGAMCQFLAKESAQVLINCLED